MKIYLVEDSTAIRFRLKAMIEQMAEVQIVGEAGDAAGAMREIGSLKPDVVILDLLLRQGSGFEVLANMKSMNPRSIVIVLSNYSGDSFRRRSIESGADHFFDKSTEFEAVVATIKDLQMPRALNAAR